MKGGSCSPIVRPDTYALKVTMPGFKTVERTNVVVNANDQALDRRHRAQHRGRSRRASPYRSRVSELQEESGERSFTLESETIKNIANDGRSLFDFATLVPGVLPRPATGAGVSGPADQASGFTVNGQRPNSNNMTIDGVTNIDTGDNGGNMATTNIDAVAEFKILTNAYQAEYGRATSAARCRWSPRAARRPSTAPATGTAAARLEREQLDEQARGRAGAGGAGALITELPDVLAQRLWLHARRPIYIPAAFNTDKKKLFFFWSQEYENRDGPGDRSGTSRVPTALERRGDFSQSVDNKRQPVPLHP